MKSDPGRAIILVPIGDVPAQLVDDLTEPLSATFELPCRSAPAIPIPDVAYDAQRGQYRGSALLAALARQPLPDARRALGLIDADCYAPGLNFILGQANLEGRDAFVALARLRPSFYGLPEDPSRFQDRLLKEAVHELGHTFGLTHCPDPGCVMHFSNSLQDTDRKRAVPCPDCTQVLRQNRSQAR